MAPQLSYPSMKIKTNKTKEKLLDYVTALRNSLLTWWVVTTASIQINIWTVWLGVWCRPGPGIYLLKEQLLYTIDTTYYTIYYITLHCTMCLHVRTNYIVILRPLAQTKSELQLQKQNFWIAKPTHTLTKVYNYNFGLCAHKWLEDDHIICQNMHPHFVIQYNKISCVDVIK